MFVPLEPTPEARAMFEKLDKERYECLVKNCLRTVLQLAKDKSPIKRYDLLRETFANTPPRLLSAILQEANKQLYKNFGFRLYELEDKTRYLLINAKPDYNKNVIYTDETCEELTILYLILMSIFASADQRISAEEIQKSLKPLDLSEASFKSYIDKFKKSLYIRLESKQDMVYYCWGPRAVAEVDPDVFFERFLDMVDDQQPDNWPDQKKRIERLKSIPNR